MTSECSRSPRWASPYLATEGLALQALLGADVVAVSITEALDLLLYPRRLVASLRR